MARLSGCAPLFQQSAVAILCEGLVEQTVETLGGGWIVGGAGVRALSHRSGTAALHVGDPPGGENPHCHLVISERANDGLELMAETWFKRYNGKHSERGGARKFATSSKRTSSDVNCSPLRGSKFPLAFQLG